MSVTDIRQMLLWGIGLNYGILLLWFLAFVNAHDWMYRLHTRWFRLPIETFDAIHYAGMAAYKIGIMLLMLTPWIALSIVS